MFYYVVKYSWESALTKVEVDELSTILRIHRDVSRVGICNALHMSETLQVFSLC